MSGTSSTGPRKYQKYCIVPGCVSSSSRSPNKRFISVPKNEARRKAWLKAVQTTSTYSKSSNILICEDHFDLKEDAQNYLKLQFFPGHNVVIKEGVVPHIFQCQPEKTDVLHEENTDEGKIEEKIISGDHQTASTDEIDIGSFLHVEMREKNLKEERISDDEGALDEENVPLIEPTCVLVEGNMDGGSLNKKELICDDQEAAGSGEVILGEKRLSDEKKEIEKVNVPGAIKNNCHLDKHKSNTVYTDFRSRSPRFESVFIVMPKIEGEDNDDNENGSTASDSRSGQSSKCVDSFEASNRTHGANFPLKDDLECEALESPPLPTGQEGFACSHCEKKFSNATSLSHHMYRMHCENAKERFACPVCEKVFPAPSHLKVHFRTHSGERPYTCPVCNKGFALSGNLKLHIRTHTGEKPYVCSECSRGFSTPASLRSHMATHTGERPFVCPACNKRFSRISHLNVHIRTAHIGEKPFECPQCGKRFFSKTHLRSHIRTHTGEKPFVCPHCDGCFTAPNSLKKHLRLHTEEKRPYVCLEDLKEEGSKLVT